MPIDYRVNQPIAAAAVADLFRVSGIRRPADDLDRIQAMIDHANLTITAWDGDRLVGVGRALTDFRYCCYLSDLAVDRAYQRQGIGREIVARMRATLGPEVTLLLLAAPEAMEYYPRIGFSRIENGWIINRDQ